MSQDPTSPKRGGTAYQPQSSDDSWNGRGEPQRSASFGSSADLDARPSYAANRSHAPSSDYQPSGRALVLVRQPARRPSASSVVLAASLGAIAGIAIPFMLGRRSKSGSNRGIDRSAETSSNRQFSREQRIPIFEEQLIVGKESVPRGGARVHSHIEERPVHEQVSLREEHVSVERRPASDGLQSGEVTDDMLRERNIEVTAMAERPVVSKEAHVREEVVVTKSAEQRLEDVQGTVRHTEVDVEDGRGGEGLASSGSTGAYERKKENGTT